MKTPDALQAHGNRQAHSHANGERARLQVSMTAVDREITARCIALLNRADPGLLTYMQYHINQCDPSKGDTYKLAKEFGQQLINNTQEVIAKPPVYKDGMSLPQVIPLLVSHIF